LLYEKLAREPYVSRVDWQHTHLFWGDERCVPSDNPDSNYFLALQTLISKVDVPPSNIHRIPAATGSPKVVAEEYEKTLREFFQAAAESDSIISFPSFDLVLLGMGLDGCSIGGENQLGCGSGRKQRISSCPANYPDISSNK
jgi:6-phosphogluconolactonase